MSFNKVILVGNLTADPELKMTSTGTSVTSFTIAVNRKGTKEGVVQADFINIVAWRGTAELIVRYFGKGSPILVCGQIQTRNYTTGNGEKRYVTEVVADEITFVGKKSTSESGTVENSTENNNPNAYPISLIQSRLEELGADEELPF